MNNNVDIEEELREKHQELLINKNGIDLETAMESFLLFYSNRCDVILENVIYTIINEYIANADSSKKDEAEQVIRGFFALYKASVETIVNEKTKEVKDNIDNIDSEDYSKKQHEMVDSIIKKVSENYLSTVKELITAIKTCDANCSKTIDDYLTQKVFKILTDPLQEQLKYSMGTINNNFGANISHIEEINARTLNKVA